MPGRSSIREALGSGTERLKVTEVGSTAQLDAQLLLMHSIGQSRAFLLANPEYVLREDEQKSYDQLIARRALCEPVQYILGTAEFYGLPFFVDENVLIPRPETEHLVEAVLQRLSKDDSLSIVDVGTGSGAIAIALASHLPQAHLTALDISPGALGVARRNASSNGVADRIRFLNSDLLAAVCQERFDVVVSNPPYIANEERESLSRQVKDFEPASALFAGHSGFEFYDRLIPAAKEVLKPGGWLLMEIGHGQCEQLATLLQGWEDVSFIQDLQGIPRVGCARRA